DRTRVRHGVRRDRRRAAAATYCRPGRVPAGARAPGAHRPDAESARLQPRLTSNPLPWPGDMRLLVVEDDPTIASFLVKGLQDAGFAVDHATSGGEALNLGSSEDYAVAVVDVMLPGMDGLALIEELRRRRIRTPVIILSARRSVDDRVKGLQAGGDDYLTKPFAFAELLARVQAL